MNLLAIELSSGQGSAALLRSGKTVAEESWNERVVRGQQVFTILPDLLRRADMRIEDVDTFAAGRGPGNYSGLRIAITAARSFALPGRKTVYAVNSGEALALQLVRETGALVVAVVGDARRDALWYGVFVREGDGVEQQGEWALAAPGELGSVLPAGALVATPHWDRLEAVAGSSKGIDWISENRYPCARFVGEIAATRIAAGVRSEAFTPVYMHPAVRGA